MFRSPESMSVTAIGGLLFGCLLLAIAPHLDTPRVAILAGVLFTLAGAVTLGYSMSEQTRSQRGDL